MFALFSALAMCHFPGKLGRDRHKIFPNMPADRIGHFECFNIVRMMDRMSRVSKTEEEITKALGEHCARLEDPRKNICTQIVPAKLKNISALLKDKKRPDFICDSIGFTRQFGRGRVITKEKCAALVDTVKKAHEEASKGTEKVATNTTSKLPGATDILGGRVAPWMHKSMGLGVCKNIEDHEERTTCQVVARFTMRVMHDEIEKGMSSDSVCEKLAEKMYIKFTEEKKAEEAPKTEEKKAEEAPKTEEKKAEEAPKAEEKKAEEAPKAEEKKAEEAPKAEEKKAEEAPKAEEKK